MPVGAAANPALRLRFRAVDRARRDNRVHDRAVVSAPDVGPMGRQAWRVSGVAQRRLADGPGGTAGQK